LNNLKQIINYENVGHGEGLNQGIKEAAFDFVLFLDVDCHALSHEWEKPFFELAKIGRSKHASQLQKTSVAKMV
jgi:GT2 family glycosyltransferase